MKCNYCDNDMPDGVSSCPFCGAALSIQTEHLSPEQLRQIQKQEALKLEQELLRHQLELEKENAELEKLRIMQEEEANKSPCKKSIFVLLGLFFGFLGIQFLYARRFCLFAFVLACFVISMIYRNSDLAPCELFVILASFIASILISTDGQGRKMKWF